MTNLMDAKYAADRALQALAKLTAAAELAKKPVSKKVVPIENPEDKLMSRFMQTELLAHDLAYTLELGTTKADVKDEDGVVRQYEIIRPDPKKVKNKGLVAFVLYSMDDSNPRVHVLFRGTHNTESIMRDHENILRGGPGAHSFNQYKDDVLDAIVAALKFKQPPVELNVAGHSLGGADAQNCVSAIFDKLTHKQPDKRFATLKKIGTLNIMHANSAGVTYAIGKKCKKDFRALKAIRPDFNVNQYVIHVHGDAVQQGGYTTIFAGATNKQVNTNLLEADSGQKGNFTNNLLFSSRTAVIKGVKGTYIAHTTKVFGDKEEKKQDISFKIYNNQIPGHDIIIENHLKNKVLRNLYKVMISPYKMLMGMKSAASSVCEAGASMLGWRNKNKNK